MTEAVNFSLNPSCYQISLTTGYSVRKYELWHREEVSSYVDFCHGGVVGSGAGLSWMIFSIALHVCVWLSVLHALMRLTCGTQLKRAGQRMRKQITIHLVCHGRNTVNLTLPLVIIVEIRSDALATRQMSRRPQFTAEDPDLYRATPLLCRPSEQTIACRNVGFRQLPDQCSGACL